MGAEAFSRGFAVWGVANSAMGKLFRGLGGLRPFAGYLGLARGILGTGSGFRVGGGHTGWGV